MKTTIDQRQNVDESARLSGFIASMLSTTRTTQPVEVIAVSNAGGVSPIGYVDIKPLVKQLGADGVAVSHAVIYNVPYLRIQGGADAVILDPHVGDIGLAAFCDRDISAVKANKKESPPGSMRKHDMSDAVYLFSMLTTQTPNQYVRFKSGEITIHGTAKVRVECVNSEMVASASATITTPSCTIDAATTHITGALNVDGSITGGTITGNGKVLDTHTHSGVTPGSGNSGAPN